MNRVLFEELLKKRGDEFESCFSKYFEHSDPDLARVSDAMKYSALGGGKRIRPFIVTEVCEMLGADKETVMPLACALECVHTYSLIHDDLPCMDNDDFRRGKPTCHKVYGEELALLAGDGLLTYAFEIIADADKLSDKSKIRAVKYLSNLAGICGMVGGQTIDLESEGKNISIEKLEKLHRLKTGALLRCAALLGTLDSDISDSELERIEEYASKIGLAFQIADDILDVTADENELGKPVGSDAQNEKVTYLSFMSIEDAKKYAKELAAQAKESIKGFENNESLSYLADYIVDRTK